MFAVARNDGTGSPAAMSDNEPSAASVRKKEPKAFGKIRFGGLWLNARSPIRLYGDNGVASATEQPASTTATAKSLCKQRITPPLSTDARNPGKLAHGG